MIHDFYRTEQNRNFNNLYYIYRVNQLKTLIVEIVRAKCMFRTLDQKGNVSDKHLHNFTSQLTLSRWLNYVTMLNFICES